MQMRRPDIRSQDVPLQDVPLQDLPSEELETFISLARKYLASVYTTLATERVTPSREAELWHLVNGVEAAMRMRAVVFNLELAEIDRDLAGVDGEIEQLCRPPRPLS
jgi:hypothetical protein